jgi:hypothetical protein
MPQASVHRNSPLKAVARLYQGRRYAILFYTLLVTLVAMPLASATEWAVLIEFFLAANLLAAAMPLLARRRHILLVAIAVACLVRPLAAMLGLPILSALTLGVWTLLGLVAAASALHFALRATDIDAEHLHAALSAYLLAGIFFGLFYWVLDQLAPAAFAGGGGFSQMSAMYFSFVTLATLGYGDIVPHTDLARGVAMVEGIGGQLFLAVLVARLVSLYSRRGED